MECNKDEAIRAKGIAEKKMESTDFVGARKIAIKAQRLYPGLENIGQMICVCDVHCSAENKISGNEKDWYDILKVEQSADEVSIKKQYRKLALLLHPDKNKFAGAEAAFMLMGEAQKVLLDREKRSFFDARYKIFSQNTAPNNPPPPPPPAYRNANNVKPPSGQTNTTKNATSHVKKQAKSVKPKKATSHVKKQPQQQANNVKPPSGQTNTTKNAAPHHVTKKPEHQANNVKPPSGQTNTTKCATSHVKQQPQQQANSVKPCSGETNTTKNATSQVKQQPQQQANSVKPPSGQTNTTKSTATSRKQAKSGASNGTVTFRTVCPFCAVIYRYHKYYRNGNIVCGSCKMNFTAYESCAETTTPQSNANQTDTRARGVSNQGGSCSSSNARFQGSSGQQKPGVDSVANSGKGTQVGRSKKTSEVNMGAKNINRPTSGGSDHSRMSIGKRDKKQVVEPGRSFQSKVGTSSKDTGVGSGCGGDGVSHQRSPQLKGHVSYNGIGSDDGALNSPKRFRTSA